MTIDSLWSYFAMGALKKKKKKKKKKKYKVDHIIISCSNVQCTVILIFFFTLKFLSVAWQRKWFHRSIIFHYFNYMDTMTERAGSETVT